jgi:hypothetical protein
MIMIKDFWSKFFGGSALKSVTLGDATQISSKAFEPEVAATAPETPTMGEVFKSIRGKDEFGGINEEGFRGDGAPAQDAPKKEKKKGPGLVESILQVMNDMEGIDPLEKDRVPVPGQA